MENKKIQIGTKVYYEGELTKLAEKKKVLLSIFVDYLKYKCRLNLRSKYGVFEEGEGIYSNNFVTNTNQMEMYVAYINYILSKMSKECREVIQKDYIECADSLWWEDYYSRSTYFRNKSRALDEFISYVS